MRVARIVGTVGLWFVLVAAIGVTLGVGPAFSADEYELPPIDYSNATPHNPVVDLQAALDRPEPPLRFDEKFGYLPGLLEALKVPVESQMLVFSKTSLQRSRIAPRTPRSLYFNDDVYVGYCHSGDVLEISVADPQLGAVFYSLDQTADAPPKLVRETHKCLLCHGSSQTDDVPGHTVRSLFVDAGGFPLLAEGTHRIDYRSPIEERWGGWYVTGTHGTQTHLGNLVVRDKNASKPWIDEKGQNLTDLTGRIPVSRYLTPHSDLIALLAFEHQTHVHNLITQANFTARQALHYEASLNKALGEPADNRLESTTRRIANAADKLVQGLLFVGEAPLKGPYVGTSGFAEEFSKRGPRDAQGRSLRDFDLNTRIFKYPCSYLIYSPTFDGLPPLMKEAVAARLRGVLAGEGGETYSHLTETDRGAITEILKETKPDLWNAAPAVKAEQANAGDSATAP